MRLLTEMRYTIVIIYSEYLLRHGMIEILDSPRKYIMTKIA